MRYSNLNIGTDSSEQCSTCRPAEALGRPRQRCPCAAALTRTPCRSGRTPGRRLHPHPVRTTSLWHSAQRHGTNNHCSLPFTQQEPIFNVLQMTLQREALPEILASRLSGVRRMLADLRSKWMIFLRCISANACATSSASPRPRFILPSTTLFVFQVIVQ